MKRSHKVVLGVAILLIAFFAATFATLNHSERPGADVPLLAKQTPYFLSRQYYPFDGTGAPGVKFPPTVQIIEQYNIATPYASIESQLDRELQARGTTRMTSSSGLVSTKIYTFDQGGWFDMKTMTVIAQKDGSVQVNLVTLRPMTTLDRLRYWCENLVHPKASQP